MSNKPRKTITEYTLLLILYRKTIESVFFEKKIQKYFVNDSNLIHAQYQLSFEWSDTKKKHWTKLGKKIPLKWSSIIAL